MMRKRRNKRLNIQVTKRDIFTALLLVIVLAFILSFQKIADVVARAIGGLAGMESEEQIAKLGADIADVSGNIFTGGIAVACIWLAVSVVAAPVAAIAFGAIGIAFAAFTVYNIVKRQGPNDALE